MNKTQLLIPAAALAVAGAVVFGTTPVFAQDTASGQTPLIQKIATKFGLKQEDVQAVFDQDRQERHAAMETKYGEWLTQAVNDGKLTEAQKTLILAKHKELEASRQQTFASLKDKTPEERKAVMEKQKADLDAWAKQNNIDIHYLMGFGRGMRGHRGM